MVHVRLVVKANCIGSLRNNWIQYEEMFTIHRKWRLVGRAYGLYLRIKKYFVATRERKSAKVIFAMIRGYSADEFLRYLGDLRMGHLCRMANLYTCCGAGGKICRTVVDYSRWRVGPASCREAAICNGTLS